MFLPTARHRAARDRFSRLLEDEGLPQPDEVVYDEHLVVFLWHEDKLAVEVELEPEAA